MARQGKIARLPAVIREELCQRMLDGQLAPQILPWLNGLPDVVRLLEEDFEGLRVTDKNLSDWRLGGYAEWLRRREAVDRTRDRAQWAVKLARASGGNLAEGASAILSGQILELLEQLEESQGAEVRGQRSEEEEKNRVAATAEAIEGLTLAVARLRKGDQNAETIRIMRDRLDQAERVLGLEREKFEQKTCELFLVWSKDARAREIAESTVSNAEKIALLRQTYFADVDALEKTGDVRIPK